MFAYVLRRLLLMVPTTLGIALVVFLIYRAVPGDPATVMIGMGSGEMSGDSDVEARIDAFRRRYGLDRSAVVQFLNYVGPFNLLRDGTTHCAWALAVSPGRRSADRAIESPGEG